MRHIYNYNYFVTVDIDYLDIARLGDNLEHC